MELVDFKYVFCPVLTRELRLKRSFERSADGKTGRKKLVDCTGARKCGAITVLDEKVEHDFSQCPFNKVNFFD